MLGRVKSLASLPICARIGAALLPPSISLGETIPLPHRRLVAVFALGVIVNPLWAGKKDNPAPSPPGTGPFTVQLIVAGDRGEVVGVVQSGARGDNSNLVQFCIDISEVRAQLGRCSGMQRPKSAADFFNRGLFHTHKGELEKALDE
jgi:hypothetical protein